MRRWIDAESAEIGRSTPTKWISTSIHFPSSSSSPSSGRSGPFYRVRVRDAPHETNATIATRVRRSAFATRRDKHRRGLWIPVESNLESMRR